MSSITYHVALPFSVAENGDLVAGEPQEARSPSDAIFKARALARAYGGAIAFTRTGDDATGEFVEAVIHARCGHVPEDLIAIGA